MVLSFVEWYYLCSNKVSAKLYKSILCRLCRSVLLSAVSLSAPVAVCSSLLSSAVRIPAPPAGEARWQADSALPESRHVSAISC